MWDAEGSRDFDSCPKCKSRKTITYSYTEGFTELECEACGYTSEHDELSDLGRYRGELKEGKTLPPIPLKKLKA